MTHIFEPEIVSAVLRHMNGDHTDDNILIVRAFATDAPADVTDAVMSHFDGDGGVWTYSSGGVESELRVPWPGGPISDRPSVRREVVEIYDLAHARLGTEPRPHD